MQQSGSRSGNPAIKQLVAEASRALALLDADRLEELALSCQVLNRNLAESNFAGREDLRRQAADAAPDLAVLGRVLDATRANLNFTHRLRAQLDNRLEYTESQVLSWAQTEPGHGDD